MLLQKLWVGGAHEIFMDLISSLLMRFLNSFPKGVLFLIPPLQHYPSPLCIYDLPPVQVAGSD